MKSALRSPRSSSAVYLKWGGKAQSWDKELQAYFSHALYVSNDQTHIADQPGASNPVDDPIKIEPDDQLTTINQFGNATEDIKIGRGPDQEMCNMYLMYNSERKTRRDPSSMSAL